MKSLFTFCTALIFSFCVEAAEDLASVRVDVPTADSRNVVDEYQRRPRENLELGMSTWAPELMLHTRQQGELALEPHWPTLSARYVSEPLTFFRAVGISFLAGLSYLQLLPKESQVHRIHLLMGSLGLQVVPEILNFKYASFFGRFELLPIGLLAATSVLASESNHFEMPLQFSLGAFLKNPFRRPSGGIGNLIPSAVNVAYVQTFNAYGDADLAALGINVGLCFPL
jgi:hypothetical protein